MIVRVLTEQVITVPDETPDEEIEQIVYDLARAIPLHGRHAAANLLGVRLGNGPVDLRCDLGALRAWFPTRTGG
jgi:hypothetical protein